MSKANRPESEDMALVKLLRGGQLTLPAGARKALRLKEGDYLEAEVTEGGLLLKPVAVVDRRQAWRKIREAQAAVRYTGPEPRPSPEEEEEQVYEIVRESRRDHG
jgi:AbrB family looped-hinge helix DNA binding protein